MSDRPVIAVIGGYGGMGLFFSRIFRDSGFPVILTGPNEAIGREAASRLGAEYIRDNREAASRGDIVLISVPINVTLEVIQEVASCVRKGCLLMDVTSVKQKPCEYMNKYAGEGVEVVGTHPMFSHRVGSLEGQVFVLTPVRPGKWYQWLKDFLAEHKARVYESTPQEHDHVMAVVQGLTHFTYISVGKTLERLDFNIKESRKFSSPIYELMLDMVGRIIGQNPGLYASIQMENPEIPKIHEIFLETAGELASSVRNKDSNKFIKIMKDAARHFDDLERAMGRSDKAIKSLISELDYLKNSVGRDLCLRHIYSGKIHYGIVKAVTSDTVVLELNGRTSELKISNLQVLGDVERIECKKKVYGIVSRDYSIVFDESVDELFIAKLLEGFDEDIVKVSVKDVYRGEKIGVGRKSICFNVELIDFNVGEVVARIEHFFKAVGGVRR